MSRPPYTQQLISNWFLESQNNSAFRGLFSILFILISASLLILVLLFVYTKRQRSSTTKRWAIFSTFIFMCYLLYTMFNLNSRLIWMSLKAVEEVMKHLSQKTTSPSSHTPTPTTSSCKSSPNWPCWFNFGPAWMRGFVSLAPHVRQPTNSTHYGVHHHPSLIIFGLLGRRRKSVRALSFGDRKEGSVNSPTNT